MGATLSQNFGVRVNLQSLRQISGHLYVSLKPATPEAISKEYRKESSDNGSYEVYGENTYEVYQGAEYDTYAVPIYGMGSVYFQSSINLQ